MGHPPGQMEKSGPCLKGWSTRLLLPFVIESDIMQLETIILEFVKALAWPFTTLLLAAMFRKEIRAVLTRIRKAVLPGGVSFDLEHEIRETKELAVRIESSPPPPGRPKAPALPLTEANSRMIALGLTPTPSGLDLKYYRTIAASDPNLALAGLRIEVEILTRNLAKGFKIKYSETDSITALLRRLLDAHAITSDQFSLTKKILSILNEAVHGKTIPRWLAEEMIESAQVLVDDYLAWLSWGFGGGWSAQATVS